MTGDQKARVAVVAVVLGLAVVCAFLPSWPLAAVCAVVALVLGALVWEADRLRRVDVLLAQVEKIEEAVRTHKAAIADLKQALVSRRLSDDQPNAHGGVAFPGFGR